MQNIAQTPAPNKGIGAFVQCNASSSESRGDIQSSKGWIQDKRSGTLVFSIPELQKVERALRHAWDLNQFLAGAKAREQVLAEESIQALAAEVDKYVRDPLLWAWLTVIAYLAKMLAWSIVWESQC